MYAAWSVIGEIVFAGLVRADTRRKRLAARLGSPDGDGWRPLARYPVR